MKRLAVLLGSLLTLSSTALPGGSGDSAVVIADPTDRESMYVAHYYQAAHGVPASNVIYMRPGAANFEAFRTIRARAFLGELTHRGLEDHVDFAVLAPSDSFYVSAPGLLADGCFPVKRFALASCYTLARRMDALMTGGAVSQINQYSKSGYEPLPFDASQGWLSGDPSDSPLARRYFMGALLGWRGQNGNTLEEILGAIDNAVASEATHPLGTFYFMETTDNVRSDPRDHAFAAAVSEMAAAGGFAEHLFADLPIGEHDCLGVMTGLANPPIDTADLTLLPGAFADHLTSYAGTFDNNSQTKMSRWIAKGACGTSGTVEEPCNYSGKFPHVRLHVEYFKGLTLGEAWLRSMLWEPYQNLFYGDPLAQPFAQPPAVDVPGLPVSPVAGTVALTPSAVATAPGAAISRLDLLVDGALVESIADGAFQLDTTLLADGWHDLRVVATDDSAVGNTATFHGSLDVTNSGLTAALGALPTSGDLATRFDLSLDATGGTVARAYVLQNGRVVASAASLPATVPVHGVNLGAGPLIELVAEVHFQGGGRARSAPLALDIALADGAPLGTAPIAYDAHKTLRDNCEAALVELPAAFDADPTTATYTIESAPLQAAILEQNAGPYVVLLPDETATGSDTLTFRVETPEGVSNLATVELEYLNEGCAPPAPVLTTVTPTSTPSVIIGTDETVTLTGERLLGVTDISVNGKPLPFPPTFTVVDDQTITLKMPLVDTLGPVAIEVAAAHGTASISIEIIAPNPPVLELGDGNDPELLFSFLPIRLVAGGQPDTLTIFMASLDPAPSILPGIWSLDLGGNHVNLVIVTSELVGAKGWTSLELFTGGLPPGAGVYFQNVEYDPVLGDLPVEASNRADGQWVF